MSVATIRNFVQLFCLGVVLFLSSAKTSPVTRGRQQANAPKAPRIERGKFSHWGPQNFLGWLPMRTRRTELDNSISTFAAPAPTFPEQVSPEASAMGESIMEEFIMFLTLKDAGLLDLCMQFK